MANKSLIRLKKMFLDFEATKDFAYCVRNVKPKNQFKLTQKFPSMCILLFVKKCVVNKATDDGHVEIELKIADEHLNSSGTIHGGFTATLVNIASTAAILASGRPTSGRSVDLSVSYQSAAKPGETIIAESTVQKTTRNLAFINTKVYRKTDNMSIATGQDTKTFLPAE